MRRFLLSLTMIVALSAMSNSTQASSMQVAFTYQTVTPAEPSVQLIDDALALGLDLSDLKVFEARRGWWKLETAEYVLSRNAASGHFHLLKKLNQKIEEIQHNVGEEPVSGYDLQDEALDMMELLGISLDEIRKVDVKRIVDQTEDELGNDVGIPQTAHFLIYVTRELNSLPVSASNAKIRFSPEGELEEITLQWRGIEKTPVAADSFLALSELEIDSKNECENEAKYSQNPLTIFYGGFGYVEANASVVQDVFEPQYSYRCGFEDSPIYFHERSAIKR